MTEQQISRALDSNTFQTSSTGADKINPTVWVRQIEQFARAKTVMRSLAKEHMDLLGQAGDTLNVQFNDEIAADELTESTAITPKAFQYTQVTYTPTEYGLGVALTRKESVRSIQDIMAEKAENMGYALAKKFDNVAFAKLDASSTVAEVTPGSVAVSSIASSDTMSAASIADAIYELEANDETAQYIVVHPAAIRDLRKLSDFIDASVYGGREVVMTGEIGRYLGLRVLNTTLVPRNSTTSTARNNYVLSDGAFGVAWKMATRFDSEYLTFDRSFRLAAVQEYDIQVERPARACRLVSYSG